jgi:hypothetical protein
MVAIYLFSGATSLREYPLKIYISYSSGIGATPFIFLPGVASSSSASLSRSISLSR